MTQADSQVRTLNSLGRKPGLEQIRYAQGEKSGDEPEESDSDADAVGMGLRRQDFSH
jgi:hypothetical protein